MGTKSAEIRTEMLFKLLNVAERERYISSPHQTDSNIGMQISRLKSATKCQLHILAFVGVVAIC